MPEDEIYKSDFDYKKVGKRVKEYRKAAGLTQPQLAEAVHITPQHMSRLERGVHRSYLHTFADIARVLNVSLEALIEDQLATNSSLAQQHFAEKFRLLTSGQQKLVCDYMDFISKYKIELK